MARLRASGDVLVLDSCDDETVRAAMVDADALLVRTYTGVTQALLKSCNQLKVIGRAGVGVDNIDVAAAVKRGIIVVHTPAASTQSVAEYAVGLMIALEHRIVAGDKAVRSDQFVTHRGSVNWRELCDCTIGIIGMGRIGARVAKICAEGIGMNIVYHDIKPIEALEYSAKPVGLDQLIRTSDVVTLHVPLTDMTRGLIDASRLSKFKDSATLINTSRGSVVDTIALAEALQASAIAGAAIDVFEEEPLPSNHPLLAAPNTLLTPHSAGRSCAALMRMNDVVDDVIAVLDGRQPKHPASPQ